MFRRFCKLFSESSTGRWAIVQLPCCPSKQGELSENILANLQNKWPPHPVVCSQKLNQPDMLRSREEDAMPDAD